MRAWIQFEKGSSLRFLSHLDMMRLWQRAIRRVRLPIAYSAGFNPHPKMSFASALAVGVTSEAEFLDMQFTESIGEHEFARLSGTLPPGLTIINWREVPGSASALMSLVRAAVWTLQIDQQELGEIAEKTQTIMQASSLPVERDSKRGKRSVDIRPLIYELKPDEENNQLRMLLAAGGEGGIRPREILQLLGLTAREEKLHRSALYIAAGEYLQSPMDVLLNEKEVSVNAEKDCYQL
jgi:radical SAM-linked protein